MSAYGQGRRTRLTCSFVLYLLIAHFHLKNKVRLKVSLFCNSSTHVLEKVAFVLRESKPYLMRICNVNDSASLGCRMDESF